MKSYGSYPPQVQKMLRENEKLKGLIRETSPWKVFLSNVLLFSVILFFLGLPLREKSIFSNFLHILAMGQTLNAFDFFIMDLIWFRHTKRTRFTGTEEDDRLYRDPGNHFFAFLRGIPAFILVAVIDGVILSLI